MLRKITLDMKSKTRFYFSKNLFGANVQMRKLTQKCRSFETDIEQKQQIVI